VQCPECRRVAGHAPDCDLAPDPELAAEKDFKPKSRAKLYDAVSILWSRSPEKSFITFTLPSYGNSTKSLFPGSNGSPPALPGAGTYQFSTTDPDTGDLAIAKAFSRTLEAWKKRTSRFSKGGSRSRSTASGKDQVVRNLGMGGLSYVWVAEAQMRRKEKYGGVGDLHYHLVVNQKLKHDNGQWHDRESFEWLQDNWNSQLGTSARNCVDVKPIPERITSIPSYLSKYLGKGYQRRIMSRSFQATRDLTQYAPIHLTSIPDARLTRETTCTTKDGFDLVSRYFNTRDVLEQYAGLMLEAGSLRGSRPPEQSLTRHGLALDRIGAKFSY